MPKSVNTHQRHLVAIDQAAQFLSCNPRTVRRMVSRGEISAFRIGPRLLRVDLSEPENLLRPIPTAGGGDDAAA